MPFIPGQSGNPTGRHGFPDDLKEVKKLTRAEIEHRVTRIMVMTAEQIKALREDPKTIALDLIIAGIVEAAAVRGDQMRLDFLLSRVIPKGIWEAQPMGLEEYKRAYLSQLERGKVAALLQEALDARRSDSSS